MFKNIIFDWSGTLNDEIHTSYAANMLLFKKFGGPLLTFEQYKEEFELPYMNWYNKYFPNIEQKKVNDAYIEALNYVPKPNCFPWAERLLTDLRTKGDTMAILSALQSVTLRQLIKEHRMEHYFLKVIGGIQDKRHAIKDLLAECNFVPEETVFVGDMVHDVDAGKVAGITTFAVTWGYDSRTKLMKANPDKIVDDISELRSLLLD
jgi:phosphoglycolate phosphatase